MFPERREEELRTIVEKGADMNEPTDSLLSPPHAKIQKDEDVNSRKFESFRELLQGFQRSITSDVYVLKVCRDEIRRYGMSFYKKVMKNRNILWKTLRYYFWCSFPNCAEIRISLVTFTTCCKSFFIADFFELSK